MLNCCCVLGVTSCSSEPLQLLAAGVKGCSRCVVIDHSFKSIKIHLDLVLTGSSGCIFSLERNLGVSLKDIFQQKDQIWHQYLVATYLYPIRQNSLAFFITILLRLSSEFICLVGGFFASYSLFKQYKKLLIGGFIPQSPGALICSIWLRAESPSQPYLLGAVLRLSKLELTAGFIFQDSALSTKLWFNGCKCKLLSCKPKNLLGRTSGNESVCHDQVTVEAQSRLMLMSCSCCPWRWFHVQKFTSLSEKCVLGFPCVCWRGRVWNHQ